ncbi:MAG TPA: amidohydrolase family protein, partial [Caulobacteraceae bacterium]|nr:amidohydrolase family protein [Caulobacteraceae bacterium]
MVYAPSHRDFYDADSHVMELPDFLKAYADPDVRDEVWSVRYTASLVTDEEVAVIMAQGGRHTPEHVRAQIDLGDRLIESSKEIQALGAFDGADRRTAMDMLGFRRQLVFPTHSVAQPFSVSKKFAPRVRYGAARALNRHMAAICGEDARLMGVAVAPLDEPELALAEVEFALEAGLKAIWVPHHPGGERSPFHLDLEPFWARLAETGLPFVIHVGGAPLQAGGPWMLTGRPAARDWMGGGENLRTKDIAIAHQAPESFVSMMVIDGVLERHRALRGAVVELGAGWVPELVHRLDWVVDQWRRVDEGLRTFTRKPSEQIAEQLAFTPFVFEPAGDLIDRSSAELYLFSSDYPHVEGGRNPI